MIGLHKRYKSSYILLNPYGTNISLPFSSSKSLLDRASTINSMINIPWWFFVNLLLLLLLNLFSFVCVIKAVRFARATLWYKKIISVVGTSAIYTHDVMVKASHFAGIVLSPLYCKENTVCVPGSVCILYLQAKHKIRNKISKCQTDRFYSCGFGMIRPKWTHKREPTNPNQQTKQCSTMRPTKKSKTQQQKRNTN